MSWVKGRNFWRGEKGALEGKIVILCGEAFQRTLLRLLEEDGETGGRKMVKQVEERW